MDVQFSILFSFLLTIFYFYILFVQIRNLRIGAVMKTVLPALAQAIVMHSSRNFNQERAVDNLKEKLQVLYVILIRSSSD